MRREFYTLGGWRDQESLDAVVRADQHSSVMARYRPAMADPAFRLWSVDAGALPVSRDEARHRPGSDAS